MGKRESLGVLTMTGSVSAANQTQLYHHLYIDLKNTMVVRNPWQQSLFPILDTADKFK
jgi:hypothetical protein